MAVRGVTVSVDKIIEGLRKNKGIITRTAKALGCSVDVIYNRIKDTPAVEEALKEAREALSAEYADDDAILYSKARESLHKLLDKNDVVSTLFVCKTKGDFIQNDKEEKNVTVMLDSKPFRRLRAKSTSKTKESKDSK